MIIEELHLRGFGKWRDARFSFASGINLISAPNEAGKSTLLQGILAALYGMKRDYMRTTRYLPEHELYIPWHPVPYETVVQYSVAGKSYRLHRCLDKEREQARLYLNPDWEDVTDLYQEDRRRERNFLELHLGLTRTLFADITWVKREPLAASEYLLPSLNRVDDADPRLNQMLAQLERDIAAIGRKERAENTLLGKAAAVTARKKRELEEAEQGWRAAQHLMRNIRDWEAEQHRWERERAAVTRRLERLDQEEREWQEKWTGSYQLTDVSQLDRWENGAASDEERELHQRTRRLWLRLEQEEGLPVNDSTADERLVRVENAYARGWQATRERDAIREQIRQLALQRGGSGNDSWSSSSQVKQRGRKAISLVLAGSAAVLLFTDQPALAWVSVGIAAALWLSALLTSSRRRPKEAGFPQEKEQQLRRLEQEEAQLEQTLQQLFAAWDVPDWESFVLMREEMRARAHKQKEQQLSRQILRKTEQGQLISQWGDGLRQLLIREKEKRDEQRRETAARLEEAARQIQHCRERIARASGEIGQYDQHSVARAQSEYEEACESLRRLQQKRDALILARDALQEAMAEWNKDVTPAVNRLASQVMERITAGVYRDVRLDPRQQFSVRVLEPAAEKIVEQVQCSTGTQDQLYFAQRIALLRHVSSQTEPLPLFLDDHFVHYDEERLARTLDYVLELSREHQVFLFSCHKRELNILKPYLDNDSRHAVHELAKQKESTA